MRSVTTQDGGRLTEQLQIDIVLPPILVCTPRVFTPPASHDTIIAVSVQQRQLLIMDHSHIVYVWERVELVYGVYVLNVTSVTMALYLLTALHMMSKT